MPLPPTLPVQGDETRVWAGAATQEACPLSPHTEPHICPTSIHPAPAASLTPAGSRVWGLAEEAAHTGLGPHPTAVTGGQSSLQTQAGPPGCAMETPVQCPLPMGTPQPGTHSWWVSPAPAQHTCTHALLCVAVAGVACAHVGASVTPVLLEKGAGLCPGACGRDPRGSSPLLDCPCGHPLPLTSCQRSQPGPPHPRLSQLPSCCVRHIWPQCSCGGRGGPDITQEGGHRLGGGRRTETWGRRASCFEKSAARGPHALGLHCSERGCREAWRGDGLRLGEGPGSLQPPLPPADGCASLNLGRALGSGCFSAGVSASQVPAPPHFYSQNLAWGLR